MSEITTEDYKWIEIACKAQYDMTIDTAWNNMKIKIHELQFERETLRQQTESDTALVNEKEREIRDLISERTRFLNERAALRDQLISSEENWRLANAALRLELSEKEQQLADEHGHVKIGDAKILELEAQLDEMHERLLVSVYDSIERDSDEMPFYIHKLSCEGGCDYSCGIALVDVIMRDQRTIAAAVAIEEKTQWLEERAALNHQIRDMEARWTSQNRDADKKIRELQDDRSGLLEALKSAVNDLRRLFNAARSEGLPLAGNYKATLTNATAVITRMER